METDDHVRVGEHMNMNPTRICLGVSMREAVEIFTNSEASDLVVVDTDGKFVGTLSEGDLIRTTLPNLQELIEEMEQHAGMPRVFRLLEEKGQDLARRSIDSIVIRDAVAMHPDDHIHKAASTMVSRNIRRLPVVKDGELVGTISRADVCRALIR